ncbi:MAG: hypothetical protein GMKNLPBB_00455 [Myxococcota bacterium]|nr:hypothetical protein [Myxococcota bacterium]
MTSTIFKLESPAAVVLPPTQAPAPANALGLHQPRFGLAFSGGGFRAAFFHIGVLARLAELDLLRHVEVISTVSGGSILGAYYYIHLKKLLESKLDEEITRDDYLRLVDNVQIGFLEAVQRNVRLEVFINFNLKKAVNQPPGYNLSDRFGEVYNEFFFAPLLNGKEAHMCDLVIHPKGAPEGFHPKIHNAGRRNKAPAIFINATTLNSGSPWVFTSTWMGETQDRQSAAGQASHSRREIHVLRYKEAKDPRYQNFPLGLAVAASACVPGLFPPVILNEFNPGWTAYLVDGGIFNNWGNHILDDVDCICSLVSDGSGQLQLENAPSKYNIGVFGRSTSILMERVRDLNMGQLLRRPPDRPGVVVHMKDDLAGDIDSVGAIEASSEQLTDYGIARSAQKMISEIRTDLDAFNDMEADAIMTSGYQIAVTRLDPEGSLVKVARNGMAPESTYPKLWRFIWMLPALQQPNNFLRRMQVLYAATRQFGKTAILVLPPVRKWFRDLMKLAAFVSVLSLLWISSAGGWRITEWQVRGFVIACAVLAVLAGIRWFRPSWIPTKWLRAPKALLYSTFSVVFLRTLNAFYLWLGRRR